MNKVIKMENKTATAQQLRGEFLEKSKPVIEAYIKVAMGEGALKTTDKKISDKIFDAVMPMLQKEGDVHRIQAESTADVIKLLGQGKLSIGDAKDLMSMLSIQSDIEDIKALLVKVNQLTGDGATYNG